jgi:hypothetical protein
MGLSPAGADALGSAKVAVLESAASAVERAGGAPLSLNDCFLVRVPVVDLASEGSSLRGLNWGLSPGASGLSSFAPSSLFARRAASLRANSGSMEGRESAPRR